MACRTTTYGSRVMQPRDDRTGASTRHAAYRLQARTASYGARVVRLSANRVAPSAARAAHALARSVLHCWRRSFLKQRVVLKAAAGRVAPLPRSGGMSSSDEDLRGDGGEGACSRRRPRPTQAAHCWLCAEEHDYDGGEWIDGEFYAATKRRRRHQSKEARRERCAGCSGRASPNTAVRRACQEQLYGVFAEGDSDSEERQMRRRGPGGAAQGPAFAKKPVAFVSSGVVGGDPPAPPPPPRQQPPGRDDMDTDDAPRGGLGLGASAGAANACPGLGASTGGLGFVSGSAQVRNRSYESDFRPLRLTCPAAFIGGGGGRAAHRVWPAPEGGGGCSTPRG